MSGPYGPAALSKAGDFVGRMRRSRYHDIIQSSPITSSSIFPCRLVNAMSILKSWSQYPHGAKAFADLGLEQMEKGRTSVNLERWPGGFLAAKESPRGSVTGMTDTNTTLRLGGIYSRSADGTGNPTGFTW